MNVRNKSLITFSKHQSEQQSPQFVLIGDVIMISHQSQIPNYDDYFLHFFPVGKINSAEKEASFPLNIFLPSLS